MVIQDDALKPGRKLAPLTTVVMVAERPEDIFRMRLFTRSAMYTPPAGSDANPHGKFNTDTTDGPPSPENPLSIVPAIVLITPEASTLRIRLLPQSAINRLPEPSTATSSG